MKLTSLLRPCRPAPAALFAATLLLWNSPATQAAPEVGVNILSYSQNGREGSGPYEYASSGPSGPAAASYTSANGGYAYARAEYGTLGALGQRTSPVTGPMGGFDYLQAESAASAHWYDVLTINSPGLQGQSGSLRVSFTIDGNINASGQTFYYAEYRFLYGGSPNSAYDPTSGVLRYYQQDAQNPGQNFLNVPQAYDVPFRFGVPFTLALTLRTRAVVNTVYPGEVNVDLSHTEVWNGFQGVTFNGLPVLYTATSQSGTDYTQPIVPEPGTYAMLSLGTAGAVLVCLRRRRAC